MRLSEVIEKLQRIHLEVGDLECLRPGYGDLVLVTSVSASNDLETRCTVTSIAVLIE